MRGKHNKTFQTTIIQFLERGYWIQEGFVTNGKNEIMPVRKSTINSLLNKGKIEADLCTFKLKSSPVIKQIL